MNSQRIALGPEFFADAEGFATDQLPSGTEAESDKGLHLTGLEVLAYLGAKIVVPIVCAFIKDTLYEKYKDLKTKKAAEKAKEALINSAGPFKLDVDRTTLVSELTDSLVSEGLTAEEGKRAVEETLAYVESKLASRGNQPSAI